MSAETVKKAFGTKTALIKAVYDVTLAGDDEPIPMIDRPEIQAVFAATNPRDKLARYAAVAAAKVEDIGFGGNFLQHTLHAGLQTAAAGRERLGELLIEFSIQLNKLLRDRRFHELIIDNDAAETR